MAAAAELTEDSQRFEYEPICSFASLIYPEELKRQASMSVCATGNEGIP
jgi:hypothetical protein